MGPDVGPVWYLVAGQRSSCCRKTRLVGIILYGFRLSVKRCAKGPMGCSVSLRVGPSGLSGGRKVGI